MIAAEFLASFSWQCSISNGPIKPLWFAIAACGGALLDAEIGPDFFQAKRFSPTKAL